MITLIFSLVSFVFAQYSPEPFKTDSEGRVVLFEVKYQGLPSRSIESFRERPYFSSNYQSEFQDLESSKTNEEMMEKIKGYANAMSDEEYQNFLSDLANYLPYNGDRALFKQTEFGGKGTRSPFELMTMQDTKQGICGDHHFLVSTFAEAKGWEAITIGYVVDQSQHVISGIIDPKDPNKIVLINYNTVQENSIDNQTELSLSNNNPGYEDLGTMYRIFKGKDGKQVQIGNLDNSLRGFLQALTRKDYELNKAYMGNQNFNQVTLTFENKKTVNGKQITNDIIVYEGNTNDQQIFGVAVSRSKYQELKNEQGKVKTERYHSMSMANSFLHYGQLESKLDVLNVYLNFHGGIIHSLYESEFFKFGGILGYQADGVLAVGEALAGDGNLETFIQAFGEYSKKGTKIRLAGKLDQTIALRDQGYMTDLKKDFTGNINPALTNAVGAELNITQKINDKTSVISNTQLMVSRLGNRVVMSSGILHNNSSILVGYQGGVGQMRLGANAVRSINMYQNSTGLDGFSVTFAQNFKYKNISGTASAWVNGIQPSTYRSNTPTIPTVGGTLKINIGTKKKAKKPIDF